MNLKSYLFFAFHPFKAHRKLQEGSLKLYSLKNGIIYSFFGQLISSIIFVLISISSLDKLNITVGGRNIIYILYGINNIVAIDHPTTQGLIKGLLIWLVIFPIYRILFYYFTKFFIKILTIYFEADQSKIEGIALSSLSSDLYFIFPIGGPFLAQWIMFPVILFAGLINSKFSKIAALLTIVFPLIFLFGLFFVMATVLGLIYA